MIKRPIFCRTGSKWLMGEDIISYFPPHLIYVEPFFGGGSVFWIKDPSPAEVINDLDKSLIDDYKMIQNAPLTGYNKDLNTITKLKKFYSKSPTTLQDKITKSVVRRCNGFSGIPVKKNYIYREANPYSKLKNIVDYKSRIADAIILNESYEKVIHDYDTDKTLFYLDPPYEDSGKWAYDNFNIDYVKMASILKKIKGKFILSINGSPNINKVFKDFKIIQIDKKSYASISVGSLPRIELLIMNF